MYVAYRVGAGLGPADGKIAVGLAGIAPFALCSGVFCQGLAFLYVRPRDRGPVRLPAAVGFYLGALIAALIAAFVG